MSETIGFSTDALIKKGQATGLDARKVSKTIAALLLIGFVVWLVGTFVLPFLVTVAWNLVNLLIAGTLALVLGIVLMNIWKKLPLINAKFAKILTFWIIEWDEFIIQERQIDKAAEDVEDMLGEKEKIEGKYIELSQKVKQNQEELEINQQTAQVAMRNNDTEAAEDAQLAAGRNLHYIETISPITDDMKFIVEFSTEIQKVLKRKIKNAKADLQANKDVFYAAQSGARALNSAKKAMLGDVQLNSDAEVARERVKQKIALSIGQMRTSMEILSGISKEENYRNKAKMELAKERLQAINNSTGKDAVPVPRQSLSFQGVEPVKKYGDLL